MPRIADLPPEILLLILQSSNASDNKAFLNANLVCKTWRAISLPVLLHHVNLSFHDDYYIPVDERCVRKPDYLNIDDDDYPRNPRKRQVAFIRFIINRPDLAHLVQRLTWTLMWREDYSSEEDTPELKTWEAFSLMKNVRRLDLAAIHYNGEILYARQNPDILFSAVEHIRLTGWMHRGLVKAILTSLDPTKLKSVHLDHLQDEGACHGHPLPSHVVDEYFERADRKPFRDRGLNDDLIERQDAGTAAIIPGPMWYALKLLRQIKLTNLTHFAIELPTPTESVDERNDVTAYDETAHFILSHRDTLQSISVYLGESPSLYTKSSGPISNYKPARIKAYRNWSHDLASALLSRLLPVLSNHSFPCLKKVDLRGFRAIFENTEHAREQAKCGTILEYIDQCPFVDRSIMEADNVDNAIIFRGYDGIFVELEGEELEKAEDILIKDWASTP